MLAHNPACPASARQRHTLTSLSCCCRVRLLEDIAANPAVTAAEGWATQLSCLALSLEFPPLDVGLSAVDYESARGAAGAMPLAQVTAGDCQCAR